MPETVQCFTSQDGKNFSLAGELKTQTPEREEGSILEEFSFPINQKARFVKIEAKNRAICPPWHKGAGGKSVDFC